MHSRRHTKLIQCALLKLFCFDAQEPCSRSGGRDHGAGPQQPQVMFRTPWATFPLSILPFPINPSHRSCLVPVSSSINQPHLGVWHRGGRELGQGIERGSPGATGDMETDFVTSLLPEGSGEGARIVPSQLCQCPFVHWDIIYLIPKWTPPAGQRTCALRSPVSLH